MSRYAVHLIRDHHVAFGRVCLRRSRIPVEAIGERFAAGESIAELAKDYDTTPVAIEWAVRALLRAASGTRGFPMPMLRRLEDLVPLESTR